MSAGAIAVPASRRNPWPAVLRVTVSAALLIYVFRNFHWADFVRSLRAASMLWLVVGWLLYGLPILLTSIRWQLLLRVQDIRIPLRKILAITCIGQFFNSFLLGSTGGDAMRLFYILRESPGAKARAGLSILVDRAIGLAVLAAVALCLAFTEWQLFMSRPDLRRIVWVLGGILGGSVVGGGIALVLWAAARAYWRSFGTTAAAVGLTIPVHLSTITGCYCAARALGIPIRFGSMAVILATVFFVIAVPVTVSGHGLRESIFVLMFSLFGVSASAALIYSMCYLGFTLAWSIACSPAYWVFKSKGSS